MTGILNNSKHERFAQFVAAGMNKQAAYEAAGYKPDRGAASRLSSNVSIRARVEELQNRVAELCGVSVRTLTLELELAREVAIERGQVSAAVAATMAKARIHGLLTPERDDNTMVAANEAETKPFSEMTLTEQRDVARQIMFILHSGKRAEELLKKSE